MRLQTIKSPSHRDWALTAYDLDDCQHDDTTVRHSMVKAVGSAFLNQGFVIVKDPYFSEDLLTEFYQAARALLSRTPDHDLRKFELVKDGIDRGYVSSPSGAYKPVTIKIGENPQVLSIVGLQLRFTSKDRVSSVEVFGKGENEKFVLPKALHDDTRGNHELIIQREDRSIRIRRIGRNNVFQVFAQDDKHGWIVGSNHNLFPDGNQDLARLSKEIYESRVHLGNSVAHVLANFLDDSRGNISNLVVNSPSSDKTPHALRIYHYPGAPYRENVGPLPYSIRAGAHQDISLFTILSKATAPGLQIQDSNGEWSDIRLKDNTVLVMAGEILSQMTKGHVSPDRASLHIASPFHRVVSIGSQTLEDRFSAPFFFNPDLEKTARNLSTQEPITVRGVSLDPVARLVYSHFRASTHYNGLTFEEYFGSHNSLGKLLRDSISNRKLESAIYVPG